MTDIEAIMRAGGWERGREIDVSSYDQVYAENGFSLAPGVRQLLREVGGLTFTYPHPRSGEMKSLTFDPIHAIADFFMEWVPIYSVRAGKELVPVGHALANTCFYWLTWMGACTAATTITSVVWAVPSVSH